MNSISIPPWVIADMVNKESNDILQGNQYTSVEICQRIVTLPKTVDTHYTIRLILDVTDEWLRQLDDVTHFPQ